MYSKYPFEEYFIPYFRKLCYRYTISKNSYLYQECYDAGMLAYMYSICRCSIMHDKENTEHMKAYIWLLIKIYVIAALVTANDSKKLCEANGFKQMDCDDYRV